MNNIANISFFESLGSSGGTCVHYDLPVENFLGFFKKLNRFVPTSVKEYVRYKRMNPNTDPKTTLVSNIVLRPVREMRTLIESIQRDLTNTVFEESPDVQALLSRCNQYHVDLKQLLGEYARSVKLAGQSLRIKSR